MATNKNDSFDFNDDAFLKDGDDFSFDDLEQFDDSGPIKKASRMVFGSMKAVSSGALKGVLGALNSSIGYDFEKSTNTTGEAISTVASTFSEMISEGRKAVQTSKRVGLNFLPMTKKIMPDRLYKWSEEFLKKDLPQLDDTESDDARAEKENDERIASTLTDVFKATEKYQRERFVAEANDRNVDRITNRQMHGQTMSGLVSIDKRAHEISNFLRTTYTSYLKKDLELKYRSYFTARDTLKYVKAMSTVFEQKLEAIKINTGMPEIIKAEANETLLSRRTKSSGGTSKYRSEFGKNIVDNFKEATVNKLKSLNTDVLPMLQSMSETMGDMGGMMAPTKMDAVNKGLGVGARWAVQLGLMHFLGDKHRNLVKLLSGDFSSLTKGFMGRLQKYKDTHYGFLSDLIPGFRRKKESENRAATDPEAPAQFDNLIRESIISVIPAHLERIGDCVEAAIRAAGIAVDEHQQKTYSVQKRTLVSVAQKKQDLQDRLYGTAAEQNARARENENVFKANILSKHGVAYDATDEEIANNSKVQEELAELKKMMPRINKMFSSVGMNYAGDNGGDLDAEILKKFVDGNVGENTAYLDKVLGGHGKKEQELAAFLLKNMTRNGFLDETQRRNLTNRMAYHTQFHDQIEEEHARINATGDARFDKTVSHDLRGSGYVNHASDVINYANQGKAGDITRYDSETGEKFTHKLSDQLSEEKRKTKRTVRDLNDTHKNRDKEAELFVRRVKAAKLDKELGLEPEQILEMIEQKFHSNAIAALPIGLIRSAIKFRYLGMDEAGRRQAMQDAYNNVDRDEEGNEIKPSVFKKFTDKVTAAANAAKDTVQKVTKSGRFITHITQQAGNRFLVRMEFKKDGSVSVDEDALNTKEIYSREKFKEAERPSASYVRRIVNDIIRTNHLGDLFKVKDGIKLDSPEFFEIEQESYTETTLEERAANGTADANKRQSVLGASVTGTGGKPTGTLSAGPINKIADDVHSILRVLSGGKLPEDNATVESVINDTPGLEDIDTSYNPTSTALTTTTPQGDRITITREMAMQMMQKAYMMGVSGQPVPFGDERLLNGPMSTALTTTRRPQFDEGHTIIDVTPREHRGVAGALPPGRTPLLLTEIAGQNPYDAMYSDYIDVNAEDVTGKKKGFWAKVKESFAKAFGHSRATMKGTGGEPDDTTISEVKMPEGTGDLDLMKFEGDPESLFHADFRAFANRLMNKLETMGGFGGSGALSGVLDKAKGALSSTGKALWKGAKGVGRGVAAGAVGLKDVMFGNSEDDTRGILGATKDLLFGEGDEKGLFGKAYDTTKNALFGDKDKGTRGAIGTAGDFLFGDKDTGKQGIFGRAAGVGKNLLFGREVSDIGPGALVAPGSVFKDGFWYDKDGNLIPGQGTHREGGLVGAAGKLYHSASGAMSSAYNATKNFMFGDGTEGNRGVIGATKDKLVGLKNKLHVPKSFKDAKAWMFGGQDSEGKNHESVFKRAGSAIKRFLGIGEGPKYVDIYLKDKIEVGNPLLKATDQEAGVFFVDGSGRVERSKDINKPVCNGKSGDDYRILIKEDDLKVGLVDAEGHSIYDPKKSLLKRITGKISKFVSKIGKGISNKFSEWLGLDDEEESGGNAEEMTFLGKRLGFTPNGPFQNKVLLYLDAIAKKMGCDVKIEESGTKTSGTKTPKEKKPSLFSRVKNAVTAPFKAVGGMFKGIGDKLKGITDSSYTEDELNNMGYVKVDDTQWFDNNTGEMIDASQLPKKQGVVGKSMDAMSSGIHRATSSMKNAVNSAYKASSRKIGQKVDNASAAILEKAGFVSVGVDQWMDTTQESTGEPMPASEALKVAAKRGVTAPLKAAKNAISNAKDTAIVNAKLARDKVLDAVLFPGRAVMAAGKGIVSGTKEGIAEVGKFWKNKFRRNNAEAATGLNDDKYYTDPELMYAEADAAYTPPKKSFKDKIKDFFSFKKSGKKEEEQMTPYERRMIALTEASNAAMLATQKATEKTAEETEKLNEEPDKNGTLDEEGSAADQKRDIEEANEKRKARLRGQIDAANAVKSKGKDKDDKKDGKPSLGERVQNKINGWMDSIKDVFTDKLMNWGSKGLQWGKGALGKGAQWGTKKLFGEAAGKALQYGGGKGLATHALRKIGAKGAAKVLSKQGGTAALKYMGNAALKTAGPAAAGAALLGSMGLFGSKSSGAGAASQAFSGLTGAGAGALLAANAWNPVGWGLAAAMGANAMREGWNDKATIKKSWDGRNADNAHDYQKGSSAVGNLANYATFGLLNKFGGRKYVDKALSYTNLGHIVGGVGGTIAGVGGQWKAIGRGIKGNDAAMTEDELRKARAKLHADVKRGYPNAKKNLSDFEAAVKKGDWRTARLKSDMDVHAGKEFLKSTGRVAKSMLAVATLGTSSMLEMAGHNLFGDNTKPMSDEELKKARAKINAYMKKKRPGAKQLSINFEEAVEGENWATARKLVKMEDKGILAKIFGSNKEALKVGLIGAATGGIGVGLYTLFKTDQDKPLSDKEIDGFRKRCETAIRNGSKTAQKLLDQFNEAVTEEEWARARKLSNMKDKSIASIIGGGLKTLHRYISPIGWFESDQDTAMSDKEIENFRKKLAYMKSQGDTVAGLKLDRFETAVLKQDWALARQIANTPHKSVAAKVGNLLWDIYIGDEDKPMTDAEIQKFQDSMNRKIEMGDSGAKRRLDEFNDAVGRQQWRKARQLSSTHVDGVWAKVGKAIGGIHQKTFSFITGYGGEDNPMSETEIKKFKERMQSLSESGDIVAKQKLKQFEDAVLDNNWRKARLIANAEHHGIINRGLNALSNLFNSKIKEKDDKETDESKQAQRYRMILSRVVEALNKPNMGFFARHRLAVLRNEMKDADLFELDNPKLDEWADRLKDIDKSAGDLSEESAGDYEKERKQKSKLLTQQQNLLNEIIAAQERAGFWHPFLRSNLKKLFNEVEAIPLEELDKDVLNDYDEDLRTLDPKAMSTKELSGKEKEKVRKLMKRQQTLIGNIEEARNNAGFFSFIKKNQLGKLLNEVQSALIEELDEEDFDAWDEELKEIDPKSHDSKQRSSAELKKIRALVKKRNMLQDLAQEAKSKASWYEFDKKSKIGKLLKDMESYLDEELTEDIIKDWEEDYSEVDKDFKSLEDQEREDKNHKLLLRDKRKLKMAIKRTMRKHRKDDVGFFGTDIAKETQKLVNKLDSIDDDEFTAEDYDEIKADYAELDKEAAAALNRTAKSDAELKAEAEKKQAEDAKQKTNVVSKAASKLSEERRQAIIATAVRDKNRQSGIVSESANKASTAVSGAMASSGGKGIHIVQEGSVVMNGRTITLYKWSDGKVTRDKNREDLNSSGEVVAVPQAVIKKSDLSNEKQGFFSKLWTAAKEVGIGTAAYAKEGYDKVAGAVGNAVDWTKQYATDVGVGTTAYAKEGYDKLKGAVSNATDQAKQYLKDVGVGTAAYAKEGWDKLKDIGEKSVDATKQYLTDVGIGTAAYAKEGYDKLKDLHGKSTDWLADKMLSAKDAAANAWDATKQYAKDVGIGTAAYTKEGYDKSRDLLNKGIGMTKAGAEWTSDKLKGAISHMPLHSSIRSLLSSEEKEFSSGEFVLTESEIKSVVSDVSKASLGVYESLLKKKYPKASADEIGEAAMDISGQYYDYAATDNQKHQDNIDASVIGTHWYGNPAHRDIDDPDFYNKEFSELRKVGNIGLTKEQLDQCVIDHGKYGKELDDKKVEEMLRKYYPDATDSDIRDAVVGCREYNDKLPNAWAINRDKSKAWSYNEETNEWTRHKEKPQYTYTLNKDTGKLVKMHSSKLDVAKSLASKSVENAISIKPNGSIRDVVSGGTYSVNPVMHAGDDIVHNHPDGSPMSKTDIDSALSAGLRSITTVRPKFDKRVLSSSRSRFDDEYSGIVSDEKSNPGIVTKKADIGNSIIETADLSNVSRSKNQQKSDEELHSFFGDLLDTTKEVGSKILGGNNATMSNGELLQGIYYRLGEVIQAIGNHNTEISDTMGSAVKSSFDAMKQYTNDKFQKIDNTPPKPVSKGPAISLNK